MGKRYPGALFSENCVKASKNNRPVGHNKKDVLEIRKNREHNADFRNVIMPS
jgi:hypothetical protein